MPSKLRYWLPILVYSVLAVALTWPVILSPGELIPGAERSDAWNSIWSLWFVHEAVMDGRLPLFTDLLQHPVGGRLVVADPLNALLGLPLVELFGPVAAYSLICLGHSAASGLAAHALGRRLGGVGWLAGVAYQLAPVIVSHLHNGSSEAVSAGWLALTAWALVGLVQKPSWPRALGAGALLALTAISGWYAGIGAWCVLIALLLVHRSPHLVLAAVLGLGLTAPWARAVREVARAPDGLVHIKNDQDLARLRRTLGPADVRSFVTPGPFRSPDFQSLEGRPGDYVHTSYLGWSLLLLAGLALWRRPREAAPWLLALGAGVVLSVGPVLVLDGFPASLKGRAIPLPYMLLERLPGFDALSLLYRLSQVCSLALAALAALALPRREDPGLGVVMALGVGMEFLAVGPTVGLPHVTPIPDTRALAQLAQAPEGAVVNLPVTASRAYLYEQVVHGHPLTASLNTGANRGALQVFSAARKVKDEGLSRDEVVAVARREGVRYVVVHKDLLIAEAFVRSAGMIKQEFELLAEDDAVRVYQLY